MRFKYSMLQLNMEENVRATENCMDGIRILVAQAKKLNLCITVQATEAQPISCNILG